MMLTSQSPWYAKTPTWFPDWYPRINSTVYDVSYSAWTVWLTHLAAILVVITILYLFYDLMFKKKYPSSRFAKLPTPFPITIMFPLVIGLFILALWVMVNEEHQETNDAYMHEMIKQTLDDKFPSKNIEKIITMPASSYESEQIKRKEEYIIGRNIFTTAYNTNGKINIQKMEKCVVSCSIIKDVKQYLHEKHSNTRVKRIDKTPEKDLNGTRKYQATYLLTNDELFTTKNKYKITYLDAQNIIEEKIE